MLGFTQAIEHDETYHCPLGNFCCSIPRDINGSIQCRSVGRIYGDAGWPGRKALPLALVDTVSKHVVLEAHANRAALNVHDRLALLVVLDERWVVSPSSHDIAVGQRLEATHGAGVDVFGVEVFLHDLSSHGADVDFEMQAAGLAWLVATGVAGLSVVVEHGDVVGALEETGVVLPAEVGGISTAQVFELVLLSAEYPNGTSVRAVDEGEQ